MRDIALVAVDLDDTLLTSQRTVAPDGAPHSLGVFAPEATKGAGLTLVMERLRIEREAVLAIGDNACDLEMFPHARVRVVMDNAPADVKREAAALGAVTAPGNDDEGVAWALREFVL